MSGKAFLISPAGIWSVLVGSRIAFETIQHDKKEDIDERNEQPDQKPGVQADVVKPPDSQSYGCNKGGDIENPDEWADQQGQNASDNDVVDQVIPDFQPTRTSVKVAEVAVRLSVYIEPLFHKPA